MVQTRKNNESPYLPTTHYLRSRTRESSDNEDEEYESNVRRRPRRHCTLGHGRSQSHSMHLNTSDSDADDIIGSDESMFGRRSHKLKTKSSRRRLRVARSSSIEPAGTSNGHTEVSMEEDLPNQEDEGVRRSTRMRKPTHESLSSSWIMGNTRLRGYPSYKDGKAQPSGPDGIEKRESRHSRYSNRDSSLQQQNSKSCGSTQTNKSTIPKREVKEEVDDEEGAGGVEDNAEEEQNGEKTDERDVPEENGSSSDGSNNEGRINNEGRNTLRSTRASMNTESDHHKMDEAFPDMYSRVKRTRRQVNRFSYSPGHRRMSQAGSSSESDESEDSDCEQPSKRRTRGSTRGCTRKYQLRAHKPAVDRFQAHHEPQRPQKALQKVLRDSVLRRLGHRNPKRYPQDSSSSSSDSDARFDHKKNHSRHTPHNASKAAGHHSLHSKDGKPATLADIDPMALDTSIRFEHVGGLEEHIRCLQEMVVFPVLYKDIFEKFHISPPKGVLFHGPPGTGKTLIARALANECSQGDRKVTFFMRKGADCLSKWVGESERQLRLLFEQAFQKKPSIIFFDEIDGLAPVRSSKQDQIHASIVSTLLALMDGLDNRGEVIVIGATNRIDAIDPALRRPGRFDRELFFPLPSCKERQEILRIHVSKWSTQPEPGLISDLAEQSYGYCGSDLRALCAESVVHALRRTYPQIYKSSQKLLLNANKVQVEGRDFAQARASIVPASHRVAPSPARKLQGLLEPLLSRTLHSVMDQIKEIFPHGVSRDRDIRQSVHRPRLLLAGSSPQQAQTTHLAPALLHSMEHVPAFTLDLGTLYEVSARSPEETVAQVFQEARRNPPSIIFMPGLGQWWDLIPRTVQAVFLMHLEKLDMASPIFLLATSDVCYEKLDLEICNLFSCYRDEVFTMSNPHDIERENFFRPLLLQKAVAKPEPQKSIESWEELPLAPPPEPAKLTEYELQTLYEKEEHTLRELRIFLREVCAKLARNRMFFMFTKPVDILEVPDYHQIIEQPMDLETMMTKIDQHHYVCAREFLDDIDLICRNALEYNPARDQADKLIRHRACFLRDTAYALIKAEMDSDFEDRCRAISKDRKKRKDSPSRFIPALEFIHTEPVINNRGSQVNSEKDTSARVINGDLSSHSSMASNNGPVPNGVTLTSARKRRPNGWSRGLIPKKKRKRGLNDTDSPGGKQGSFDKSLDLADGTSQPSTSVVDCPDNLNSTVSPPVSPVRQQDLNASPPPPPPPPPPPKEIPKADSSIIPFSPVSGAQDLSLSDVEMKGYNSDESRTEKPKQRSKSLDSSGDGKDEIAPALQTPLTPTEVVVDHQELEEFLTLVVTTTTNSGVHSLLELFIRFEKLILKLQSQWDRSNLVQVLREELERFQQHQRKKLIE